MVGAPWMMLEGLAGWSGAARRSAHQPRREALAQVVEEGGETERDRAERHEPSPGNGAGPVGVRDLHQRRDPLGSQLGNRRRTGRDGICSHGMDLTVGGVGFPVTLETGNRYAL